MTLPRIKLKNKKPIYISLTQDIDFFGLFKKIEKVFDYCYILESLGKEGERSRYHIIGFGPEYIIEAKGKHMKIQGEKSSRYYRVQNPFFSLRKIMPQGVISHQYAGGLIGYLGYDCVNYFEKSLRVKLHPDYSQFRFGVYNDGLIYDKMTGETFYFYFNENRINIIKSLLKKKENHQERLKVSFIGHSKSRTEYKKIVENIKKEIRAGKIFQAVVGFKTKYKIRGDTIVIYKKLRKINPSPFMYYLKFGGEKIIGASPELLFRLRQGEMETIPLAGTTRRGKTEKEDKKLVRELLHNQKELAEHSMLVDLSRNDIGRMAKFGTVRLHHLMEIEKFSHVQHLSTEVVGLIRDGEDMFSALASCFPAGTLTGAPKIEAIKIIDREENEPRGVYGGGVGHFGYNGDCSFSIPIRSIFISGDTAFTQTAGGVVYDSVPEKEYIEIKNKLKAMEKVLL